MRIPVWFSRSRSQESRIIFTHSFVLCVQAFAPEIHGHLVGRSPPTNDVHTRDHTSTYSANDVHPLISDSGIRNILGLGADQELSLRILTDPPLGQRPSQSTKNLCQLAILGSPERKLTVVGICEALKERFEWFRCRPEGSWRVRSAFCDASVSTVKCCHRRLFVAP